MTTGTRKAHADNSLPPRPAETSGDGIIGRKTAWALCILFLLAISAPGIYQYFYDTHILGRWEFDDLVESPVTADSLKKFESDLSDNSRFDRWVRHSFWTMRTGVAKESTTVTIGSDGFLFPNFELALYNSFNLTDPPPSPAANVLPTFADYDSQLRARGIHLVLVLVPMKSTIYPEKLAIDYRAEDGPAFGPGYADWLKTVRAAGIDVVDLTSALWNAKNSSPEPLYFPADIHWSPRGMAVACNVLADHLAPATAHLPSEDFKVKTLDIDEEGDLANWVSFGWGTSEFPRVRYQANQLIKNDRPYVPGDEAPILLLGDSFSAIGAADAYGFSAELSRRLRVPVQTFAFKGDPMYLPRQSVLKDPACLTNKKIVIWECTQASLWQTWRKMPLPAR